MSVASAPSSHAFFATTPKGLESLLLAELAALGAAELRETRAGVAFHGPLALAYRACLWSRLANRLLLPLADFAAPAPGAAELRETRAGVAFHGPLALAYRAGRGARRAGRGRRPRAGGAAPAPEA